MKTISSKDAIERLKKGLNRSSDHALAELLGISKATLSNWKSRNSIDIPLVFSKCEQISIDWLLTGYGSMLKTKSTSASSPSCEEPTPLSKDTNNITNKQDIIEKSNALVDPFLMLIRERDATIKEQAEEIGHLKEQIRQLTLKMEQLASNAHSPTTANVV